MIQHFDELVEINLQKLYESKNNTMARYEFVSRLGNPVTDSLRFAQLMHEKGLIDLEPVHQKRCDLTELGFTIVKNGGWHKFLEAQELLHKKEQAENVLRANTELLNSKKAEYDLKLSKWKVKTFWPLFVFAFIGATLSVYNFINSLTPSTSEERLESRIEQMESELSKQHTSPSDQKNPRSSLPDKNPVDSLNTK